MLVLTNALFVYLTGKSKCEKELESALASPMPGGDTPRCDEDGSYSAKQCHSSSGYCWCVTRHGKVIPSTKLRFQQPNCSHGKNS